ncbi:TetR/AcrR family transcriptional regulator [Actinocorallia sp. A-T 12471]|uniref:TetR/AcrR family transcriptional regulator n=1 Tax=Actinocorallia sp. A-T 12471 TaxID=3089813 RepID=UPI0029D021FF|nr:TetR/AcrR family transcriptional regulator [Actinocorallia sp. A-T 12471]MDX6741856.1 TetR/AcrR family transcriptional regulator [Actinocorallia sp. A-T 12471]
MRQRDPHPVSRPRPGTVRPGGRTARTRRSVLQAALAELVEVGYSGTGVEKIAIRAGVAPSTIYRRWGSLEGVVADAAQAVMEENLAVPDTGTLEGDLTCLTRSIAELFDTAPYRAWMDVLIGSSLGQGPARNTFATSTLRTRAEIGAVIVERAVQRGEVPPDTDAAEVIRQAAAPLYYRLYISCEPVEEVDTARAAMVAASAARRGLLRKAV